MGTWEIEEGAVCNKVQLRPDCAAYKVHRHFKKNQKKNQKKKRLIPQRGFCYFFLFFFFSFFFFFCPLLVQTYSPKPRNPQL